MSTLSPPPASAGRAERLEGFRRQTGWLLAPAVFVAIWLWPIPSLLPPAHELLAVVGAVGVLWLTEAIPLPATALLGPSVCVLLGIGPAREVFRSFADPIVFLFLGSFLIAEAMLHHGLNRRIAFGILGLRFVGKSPARLLAAFGVITGFISMWVSNTATAAMMFPIGVAILKEMAGRLSVRSGRETHFTELRFGAALMLMTAFAASVGGLATPVGTPPNLIGIGLIESQLQVRIPFFQWMALGLPIALVLVVVLVVYLNRTGRAEPDVLADSARWLRAEAGQLERLSPGERNVLIAFGVTVALWILPGAVAVVRGTQDPAFLWLSRHLPESVVALLGGVLLFLLPVDFRRGEFTLTWREAARIDWGTILLFGGGLALGELMFSTGLAQWLGEGLAGALRTNTAFGLTALFAAVAIILSEATSNTASATMIVPVAIAVAQAAGVPPLQPALAACLGASMGFMLPVSTPPNAIVYGSGCVPLWQMVRHGIVLDIVGFLVIVAAVTWLAPLVVG